MAWFWMKDPAKIDYFLCEENESSFTWLKNQRLEDKMDLCPVGLKIAPFLKPFYFHFHHNRQGETAYRVFSSKV